MKSLIYLAAVSAFSVLVIGPAPVARGEGIDVVVVDVTHIFKNHRWYKSQMAKLRKEVQASEETLRGKRDGILQDEQGLKQFRPGTDQFRELQAKITRAKAELAVESELMRKTFVEEEGKIYHSVYTQVTKAIKSFAEHNRIRLVLRFTKVENVNENNPAAIRAWMANPVVFQNNIDITANIIQIIKKEEGKRLSDGGTTTNN